MKAVATTKVLPASIAPTFDRKEGRGVSKYFILSKCGRAEVKKKIIHKNEKWKKFGNTNCNKGYYT